MDFNKRLLIIVGALTFGVSFYSKCAMLSEPLSEIDTDSAIIGRLDEIPNPTERSINGYILCVWCANAINLAEYIRQNFKGKELQHSKIWNLIFERMQAYKTLALRLNMTEIGFWNGVLSENRIDTNSEIQDIANTFPNTTDHILDGYNLCKLIIRAINFTEKLKQTFDKGELQNSRTWNLILAKKQAYQKLAGHVYKTEFDFWNNVLNTLIAERSMPTDKPSVFTLIAIFDEIPANYPTERICNFLEEAIGCCWAPGIQITVDFIRKRKFDVTSFLNKLDAKFNTSLDRFIGANIDIFIMPKRFDACVYKNIHLVYVTLTRLGAKLNNIDPDIIATFITTSQI